MIITALSILSLVTELYSVRAVIELEQNMLPLNRVYDYFAGMLITEKHQKEMRLYRTDELIRSKISSLDEKMNTEMLNSYETMGKASSAGSVFNVLNMIVTWLYAGLRVLGIWGEAISLGSFSAVVSAGGSYFQATNTFIKAILQFLGQSSLIGYIFDFLNLDVEEYQEASSEKTEPLAELRFENVTFVYPKTERIILDNVSFTLKKGEKLAMVGVNNAGKSTIVKLICRLFVPTEGRILWNGTDIQTLEFDDYISEIATVFQDFQLFPLTIRQNITVAPDNSDKDDEKILQILADLNMEKDIQSLPNGLATRLDKTMYEDATNLSGGQRQKVAIARAAYKSSSLLILDEPTAALDPLLEAEIYKDFAKIASGRTLILISHRMSASRLCDRILVLDDGKITASGSHDELMKSCELYRDLFAAQAEYYKV